VLAVVVVPVVEAATLLVGLFAGNEENAWWLKPTNADKLCNSPSILRFSVAAKG
jgi:hypothetical protein